MLNGSRECWSEIGNAKLSVNAGVQNGMLNCSSERWRLAVNSGECRRECCMVAVNAGG